MPWAHFPTWGNGFQVSFAPLPLMREKGEALLSPLVLKRAHCTVHFIFPPPGPLFLQVCSPHPAPSVHSHPSSHITLSEGLFPMDCRRGCRCPALVLPCWQRQLLVSRLPSSSGSCCELAGDTWVADRAPQNSLPHTLLGRSCMHSLYPFPAPESQSLLPGK